MDRLSWLGDALQHEMSPMVGVALVDVCMDLINDQTFDNNGAAAEILLQAYLFDKNVSGDKNLVHRLGAERAAGLALLIENERERSFLAMQIAHYLVSLDEPDIAMVDTLVAQAGRPSALTVTALGKSDLEGAIERALAMPRSQESDTAFRWLASRAAETNIERARSLIDQIQASTARAQAFQEIGEELVDTDPGQARGFLEEAFAAAEAEDGNYRSKTLRSMALLDVGRALELAELLPEYNRVSSIRDIARICARSDGRRAIALAESVPDAHTLGSLGWIIAEHDPECAAELAQRLPEREASQIFGALVRAKDDWSPAAVDDALTKFPTMWAQSQLLRIAAERVKDDNPDLAKEYWLRARDKLIRADAAEFSNTSRGQQLAWIAEAQMPFDLEGAEETTASIPTHVWPRTSTALQLIRYVADADLGRALEIATALSGDSAQALALAAICECRSAAKDQETSVIAELVIEAVLKVEPDERSSLVRNVAPMLAVYDLELGQRALSAPVNPESTATSLMQQAVLLAAHGADAVPVLSKLTGIEDQTQVHLLMRFARRTSEVDPTPFNWHEREIWLSQLLYICTVVPRVAENQEG